jgi:hypothetical protein
MEVGSSTEMGAPGASHLGTGDHGPKPTEQTTISPGKRACVQRAIDVYGWPETGLTAADTDAC